MGNAIYNEVKKNQIQTTNKVQIIKMGKNFVLRPGTSQVTNDAISCLSLSGLMLQNGNIPYPLTNKCREFTGPDL